MPEDHDDLTNSVADLEKQIKLLRENHDSELDDINTRCQQLEERIEALEAEAKNLGEE